MYFGPKSLLFYEGRRVRWLITGTGRCGTGYMAQVLKSAGMNCGHEHAFRLQGMTRARHKMAELDADSSWLAVPFLGHVDMAGVKVVHLVRDPKDTIDSMLAMGFFVDAYVDYGKFAHRYLAGLEEFGGPLPKAAYFWVGWNTLVEPFAVMRHRVEDDPREVLDWMDVDHQSAELFSDTKYNTRRTYPSDVDLLELHEPLRSALFRMAERYGYQ